MKDKRNLLIISLDAMADSEIELLKEMPNFKRLLGEGTLVRKVESIFLTNTYPIHTSVITGIYPKGHGIIENKVKDPLGEGKPWYWYGRDIKTTTLYDEVRKNNMKVASLFWPVTAKAKIKYNMPEILPYKKGQTQAFMSLSTGNPWTTIYSFLRFGKKLVRKDLIGLDDFSTASMVSLIGKKKPNLALIHLLAIDTSKHKYGVKVRETVEAIKGMDEKIGSLTEVMEKSFGDDYNLIIFSDHASLDVNKKIDLNIYLKEWGYKVPEEAWFRNCGGSSFLYTKEEKLVEEIRGRVEDEIANNNPYIGRILDYEEMETSGFNKESSLGIEAKREANFLTYGNHKGNHGYSNKMEDYKVFYYIRGKNILKGREFSGGSLLDIAPLSCFMLNINPWSMDGKLRTEFIKEVKRRENYE